jgi:hypothetical protein
MLPKQTIVRGIIAGLIGATIMALWFLIIDTIQGQPLYTPAFLASILANADAADRSFALIAVYTLFHYAAFCLVGVGVTWLLGKLEVSPPILLGLVLGFVLFDLVFYLGVILTGVDVVDELGWPQVLIGNLAAGVGLMSYVHVSLGIAAPGVLGLLGKYRFVREGVIAGALGAVTVAVWFLIFDVVRGQIFFTPGALGSVLFLRCRDVAEVEVTLLTVGGYSIVHLAAFVAVGLAAAAIAIQAEKAPRLLAASVLIFVTFEAFFLGLLAVVAEWLLGTLGWLSVGLGNLLATVVMAYYLLRVNPSLRVALGRELFNGEVDQPEAN